MTEFHSSILGNSICSYSSSYDGFVRLYDARKPLTAMAQVNVEGGVWRVKWHPDQRRSCDLLTACMHSGFKIVRFSSSIISTTLLGTQNETDHEGNVIKTFDKHESLAYGVDWSYSSENESGDSTIASCSFYDHMLHVWEG